ncbi:MAG: hypothetical protein OIN66_16850 [Candidatus Methanoperedens sp.]|nr:hypothetical protein [Candidatus Methanoperedens sp.]
MDKSGKYDNIKIIGSAIATAIGLILLLAKAYLYIAMILISFGSIILVFSLEARRKGIISDELTEWISGKSANLSFTVTWSTIVLLLAIDLYKPGFLETYIALGIVMSAMVGARLAGVYYYEKISKNTGF